MVRLLSNLIVLLTALSTVLAGVPGMAVPDGIGSDCVVSAQQGTDDDDASKPRGEQDSEESEEENEVDVKLLAERAVVCGPHCDIFVSLDPMDRVGCLRLIWPTTLIRGPPAST